MHPFFLCHSSGFWSRESSVSRDVQTSFSLPPSPEIKTKKWVDLKPDAKKCTVAHQYCVSALGCFWELPTAVLDLKVHQHLQQVSHYELSRIIKNDCIWIRMLLSDTGSFSHTPNSVQCVLFQFDYSSTRWHLHISYSRFLSS